MKKVMLIVLLILMVVLAGCVGAGYRERLYGLTPKGKPYLLHEVKLDYDALNVKTQTKGIKLKLPNNVELTVDERQQIPDPNSAIAEGQAAGNVLSGGTTGTINEILK